MNEIHVNTRTENKKKKRGCSTEKYFTHFLVIFRSRVILIALSGKINVCLWIVTVRDGWLLNKLT